MFHQCADSAAVQVAEDGLFDYEVRCTVASGEPLKGLELPALGHRDQAPATGPALSSDRKEATGPSSLREAGNNCCSIRRAAEQWHFEGNDRRILQEAILTLDISG